MGKDTNVSEFKPITLESSGEEVEEVTLFVLDGEEYKIPTKVGHNITLQAMEIYANTGNPDAATMFALKTLLGPKGWHALKNFDELEEADFEAICKVADKIVMGSGKRRRNVGGSGTTRVG